MATDTAERKTVPRGTGPFVGRPVSRLPISRIPVSLVLLGLACGVAGCRSLPWVSREDPASDEPLPVRKVQEEIVLAVWAEPPHLPEGGGQAQVLVRVRKRGGKPFPDVEVRLVASAGSLYSGGRVLVTDARGMTRDRLTTRKAATITLNAGGTRYRFRVPAGEQGE